MKATTPFNSFHPGNTKRMEDQMTVVKDKKTGSYLYKLPCGVLYWSKMDGYIHLQRCPKCNPEIKEA